MGLLIKGGRLIDPASGMDARLDLLVEGERICAVGEDLEIKGAGRILDARGKVVAPGLVDMHVHLREPGREDEETIASGTRAAAAGGVTSLACMANTDPPVDNQSVVSFIRTRAAAHGAVNVHPVAAITKGLRGEELTDMAELLGAGAVAFSDDGHTVLNSGLMRRAMEYSRIFDVPLIVHCEDKNLAGDGAMNEGYVSTVLGLQGITGAAEEVVVARDIILAEHTGARLHIAHASTCGSIRLIRQAKARGVRLTAEVTPHHLMLTDEDVMGYDTNTKVNPPLRTAEDVAALKEAVVDGTIDCVASDHAPHTREEKDVEFSQAAFGMVGLETSLQIVLTELVSPGFLSLPDAMRLMSFSPSRILRLARGSLAQGAPADIVVFDPGVESLVDVRAFVGKSKNSPFHGRRLKGKVEATIVSGKLVHGEPGHVQG